MSQPDSVDKDLTVVALLKSLQPAERQALAERCQWHRFDRGQTVLLQGESGRHVAFLTQGTVRAMVYSDAGRLVTFRDMQQGDMFGDLSVIDGLPRSADITTLTPCVVATMTAEDFWWLLDNHTAVRRSHLERIAAQIRNLSDRLLEYSSLTAPERLRAELLRLAAESEDGKTIDETPTHEELAARIGSSREAVTRELNRLQRGGSILREGRTIRLVSPSLPLKTKP